MTPITKKYYEIADRELNTLFGKEESIGDQELANKTVRYFFSETVTLKMFLESTGKVHEYKAWLARFHKNNPGAYKHIQKNLELELE